MHERLVEIFGLIAMPYSTMTKIFRENCWTPFLEVFQNFQECPPNLDHYPWIFSVVSENTNQSVREIAHETRIPQFIVFYLCYVCLTWYGRNCRVVPHALPTLQGEMC
jgi:hypothetical protein